MGVRNGGSSGEKRKGETYFDAMVVPAEQEERLEKKLSLLGVELRIMRDRLMVGHTPLERGILVRVQVPQPEANCCLRRSREKSRDYTNSKLMEIPSEIEGQIGHPSDPCPKNSPKVLAKR